jgi:hypothetical protein
MPYRTAATLMLLVSATAIGSSAPAQDRGSDLDGTEWAQMTIRERIIIRIPNVQMRAASPIRPRPDPVQPMRWVEKKGPKCVAVDQLAGAAVGGDTLDLMLRGGNRVRARLDGDCPALDFYAGFYLKPSADGLVCAGRDSIRSRSGDSCTISGFKTLVLKR